MKKNKRNIRNKYSSKRNLYIGGFKIGKADELCFQEKNYNSTYGELTKSGACQLFANYPMRNKVFCDLGSGTGNVLHYVLSMFPALKKSIGLELSRERHEIAIEKYNKYISTNKMELYNMDLLDFPVSNCDYIYISNLCFPEHLNKSIGKKIDDECREKMVVFSSKEIYCKNHWKKEEKTVAQTWDTKSRIYVYSF